MSSSSEDPDRYFFRLHGVMARKINAWRLSPRAKAIALELNNISFGDKLPEVELWQHELAQLTGYSEHCVSKACDELKSEGVLQVIGKRGGMRIFRLLPQGEIIEPEARPDTELAASVRAVIRERNGARRPGEEPGGQRALLSTAEERLRDDQASASVEMALEDDARERGPDAAVGPAPGTVARDPADWRDQVVRLMRGETAPSVSPEGSCPIGNLPADSADLSPGEVACQASSGGKLPSRQLDEVAQQATRGGKLPVRQVEQVACQASSTVTEGRGPARERTRVRDVNVDVNVQYNTSDVDVRCAPGTRPAAPATFTTGELSGDAQYALELVKEVVRPSEFEAWRKRWIERCEAEPAFIIRVASDVRSRPEEIRNPGGTIFQVVKKLCAAAGRSFRMFL